MLVWMNIKLLSMIYWKRLWSSLSLKLLTMNTVSWISDFAFLQRTRETCTNKNENACTDKGLFIEYQSHCPYVITTVQHKSLELGSLNMVYTACDGTYPCKCANKRMNVFLWLFCINRGTDVQQILKQSKTIKTTNLKFVTQVLSFSYNLLPPNKLVIHLIMH